MLTRSGLTYLEISSKVYRDSFCQLGSRVSLPWVVYFEAFYLLVVSSFSCIPVICPKLVLFLNPLQFVHLFCNLSKCILLFFSCISSLLMLFTKLIIYVHKHRYAYLLCTCMDIRFNIQKLQFWYKICLYVSRDSQGKQLLFH